jgi:hypothetical protein
VFPSLALSLQTAREGKGLKDGEAGSAVRTGEGVAETCVSWGPLPTGREGVHQPQRPSPHLRTPLARIPPAWWCLPAWRCLPAWLGLRTRSTAALNAGALPEARRGRGRARGAGHADDSGRGRARGESAETTGAWSCACAFPPTRGSAGRVSGWPWRPRSSERW